MLKSCISHKVGRCLMSSSSNRCYAKNCEIDCPKPKGCKMVGYRDSNKENQKPSNCSPTEPKCRKSSPKVMSSQSPKNTPDKSLASCCNSERLQKDPCYKRRELCEKKDFKLHNQVLPLKSVWEYTAECCGNPCPEMLPRFDRLYYCASDKNAREYQQTWVECPPVQIRKRKVCCYDSSELPPLCKRAKKECAQTACAFDSAKLKALCCLDAAKKCPRLKMPCCRTSRQPPLCKNPRGPTDCHKTCCPYPSFSECCRPCPQPRRPTECSCLEKRTKCEMYEQLRRKLMYDLPPPLPAWSPRLIGPRF
ncbi:uncharacterized protein LOC101900780 [Musca domestica]|uniref:Uncharacterized protein LOC101900780 n=1 Tax=Musca domestica TaxID=7370 RepID=A0A1I8MB80_MUSDO|nr:uncharacterized protein LOC101900780 [Musca domestica]